VYYAGNSGGEACEAAMKLSFQIHVDKGKASKTWFIGREQSYHGISSDNLAFCDRPHLDIYAPFYPARRVKIAEHNEFRHRKADESPEDYAERSAQALERKILELGPDNVAGFVAETMQGGLVGAVPASPGYWRAIRRICDRHDVHLILDEVWCGNGASGRYLCVDWDGVSPDFLFMAKLLGAGYAPISVVMMRKEIAEALEKTPQHRIQHGSTYQSYTLGIAAALAAQRIVTGPGFLDSIDKKGVYIQERLKAAFSNHPFFRNVRGRGLRQAMEIACPDMNGFTRAVAARMRQDGILIDGKWHRLLFAPAFIVETAQIDHMIERLTTHFRAVSQDWHGNERDS
jgi:adenosylmethionine-8-amino-7-oxononanoate aminotransferase